MTARKRGANVTCGISINHLTLNENDIGEYRTFFKLSPPLRGEDDRVAMVEALADGTIDIIVSSHDPQDVDTKRLPFAEAADGAIGLETMLAAALRLHHSGDVPLMRLIDAMSTRPAQIFGLDAGTLKPGAKADITLIDLDEPWIVSQGRDRFALEKHAVRRCPLYRPGRCNLCCGKTVSIRFNRMTGTPPAGGEANSVFGRGIVILADSGARCR